MYATERTKAKSKREERRNNIYLVISFAMRTPKALSRHHYWCSDAFGAFFCTIILCNDGVSWLLRVSVKSSFFCHREDRCMAQHVPQAIVVYGQIISRYTLSSCTGTMYSFWRFVFSCTSLQLVVVSPHSSARGGAFSPRPVLHIDTCRLSSCCRCDRATQ